MPFKMTKMAGMLAMGGNRRAQALSSYWVGHGLGLVQDFKAGFARGFEGLAQAIE